MPLSLHTVNDVVGEIAPSRVLGLDRVPLLADPLGGGIWFNEDDHLALGERDLQLTQACFQPSAVELGRRAGAIPGVAIDAPSAGDRARRSAEAPWARAENDWRTLRCS
jgi:hypothetical protein